MWAVLWLCSLAVIVSDDISVEARLAVIDQRIADICESIQELKAASATKQETQNIQHTLSEMKELLNPRIVKVDQMEVWKTNHVREHDQASARLNNTLIIAFTFFTIVIAALQFVFDRVRRHTDNHRVDT